MILIIINFGVVLHWISRRIIDGLTNYIKQSKVFHPTSEHLEVGLKKALSVSCFQSTSPPRCLDIGSSTFPRV